MTVTDAVNHENLDESTNHAIICGSAIQLGAGRPTWNRTYRVFCEMENLLRTMLIVASLAWDNLPLDGQLLLLNLWDQ